MATRTIIVLSLSYRKKDIEKKMIKIFDAQTTGRKRFVSSRGKYLPILKKIGDSESPIPVTFFHCATSCHNFIVKGNTKGATMVGNEERKRAVAVWSSPLEIYRSRTPMH